MTTEPEISSPLIPPKRSPWIFRFLIRLLLILGVLILLVVGAGFIIGYYYQDEVKEYVIGELNKQLNTQVIVDGKDIDFTVLKNFPYASVEFRNVKALDATMSEKKDTLFKAGEISIQFSLLDIFKKNYRVKKISLDEVKLRLRVNGSGEDNYHFWKPSSGNDTSNSQFAFALEKILLHEVHISYINKKDRQRLETNVGSAKLSGSFSDQQYDLDIVSDLFVEQLKLDSTVYLHKKNLDADLGLHVDNSMPSVKFNEGKIKVEDLLFEVVGNMTNYDKQPILNLGLKGKDMDIQSVLSLIPARYKASIADYESDGEFYFNATIQGTLGEGVTPLIEADFGMKNAQIRQKKESISLNNVNLKGHYSNGSSLQKKASELSLREFSAAVNSGSLAGDLTINNFAHPNFNGHVTANIALQELKELMQLDTLESLTGMLKMNASFSGEGKFSGAGKPQNLVVDGSLLVDNMSVKLKNNVNTIENIQGDMKFDNNDIVVNNFSGKVGSSDFLLKGFFRNAIAYLFDPEEDVTIEASFHSNHIDLNELLANKEEGSSGKYKLRFSEHLNVNLNSDIQQINFRKFSASDVSGQIRLQDKKLFTNNVKLSTMGGLITTSGLVDGSDSSKLLVTCYSDLSHINISKMFEEFENFGQSAITDKNIKGIATAKINFAAVLTPELAMDMDKLYAGVDLSIDNGELNNVESMKSMSRFIELKELENIRFATLKNQIEIKNQLITIPKMEVKSSALTITTSGTHSFNNEIDYKVKLSLNELLSKKAKQAKKQNEEFGEVADDGLGRTNIFLSMTGTVEHPVIKYDSKSAIQNVKQDLKVEKQTLKSILKDEFGLFKNDSTLNAKDKVKKEDQAGFKINWEESDKKPVQKELKKPKKPEEEDF